MALQDEKRSGFVTELIHHVPIVKAQESEQTHNNIYTSKSLERRIEFACAEAGAFGPTTLTDIKGLQEKITLAFIDEIITIFLRVAEIQSRSLK
ncbi:unnamed protein product [Prunus armeniaca]|uniref:Uncharacterized protein n=1 Tax=Prunus armeniaca TaxID=36596 RepID=A0A6J5V5K6_PRUAR|nr:unnamed protein product [Prunus armeniaca]